MNKTATHTPETIWLSSISSLLDANSAAKATVAINKLDYDIDATEADLGCDGSDRLTCGVHLHGVSDLGVTITKNMGQKQHQLASKRLKTFTSSSQSINVVSLDSQLVSIGSADPAPTPLRKPDITGGVHMALVGVRTCLLELACTACRTSTSFVCLCRLGFDGRLHICSLH